MDFNKLLARVKNILLTPKTEWPVIAAEPDTVAGIFKNYVLVLAAIPAVITFLRYSVLGITVPIVGGSYRLGVGFGLVQMIVTYAVACGVTYLMMLIIDALAPNFGAEKNKVQALKSIAYAYTASWVASVLTLLGAGLGLLILLAAGGYGIYLLYLGLPHTMKCPQDRAGGYAAVAIIIAIVLGWIVGFVVMAATGMNAAMSGAFSGAVHSSSYAPDRDSALGALAAMGQKAAEAGKKMEEAKKSGDAEAQGKAAGEAVGQVLGAVLGGGDSVEALAPDLLKPFVPETLAGLPRTDLSVERNAAIGIQVSHASASYRNAQGGGPEFHVEITDTGGAKGVMALAGFAGIEEDKQNDSGYEKTYHLDGRLVHEQWDKSGDGEFTVVLGSRFIVEVRGSGLSSMDALKAAAGSLNLAGLEAMKNTGVKKG